MFKRCEVVLKRGPSCAGRSATTYGPRSVDRDDQERGTIQIIHEGARREVLRQELRASQQAVIANEFSENSRFAQMQEERYRGLYEQSRINELAPALWSIT